MRKIEEQLRDFLSGVAEMMRPNQRAHTVPYSGTHDLVLKHGQFFSPGMKPKSVRWGKFGQCFMNAFKLASRDSNLTYVEGFASSIIPLEHAWVVTPDGVVIDNTWRDVGTSQISLENRAYYGIPFDIDFVRRTIAKRGLFGVIDAYDLDFPLLTGEVDVSAVKVTIPRIGERNLAISTEERHE